MSDIKQLPPGYTAHGEPVYVRSEDCMGRDSSHWTHTAAAPPSIGCGPVAVYGSAGPLLTGTCVNAEGASRKLSEACWADYRDRVSQRPAARLAALVDEAVLAGRFTDARLVEAVALIATLARGLLDAPPAVAPKPAEPSLADRVAAVLAEIAAQHPDAAAGAHGRRACQHCGGSGNEAYRVQWCYQDGSEWCADRFTTLAAAVERALSQSNPSTMAAVWRGDCILWQGR